MINMKAEKKMTVTMKDIAKAAQVDPSVVSAVLNGSKSIRVSSERRSQIQNLAESMNYRPNLIARSLITKKSFTIGVLFFSTRDRFYASMMAELQDQLLAQGYVGIYAFWNNIPEVKRAYDVVLNRRVDGIITCHNDPALLPTRIPTIIFEMPREGYDSVSIDYESTFCDSVKYLTGLGHRRIGYLGGRHNDPIHSAFLYAMKHAGLEVRPEWMAESSGFMDSSFPAALKLLQSPGRPTALLTKNDMVALSVINAARRLGMKVPDDLSVLGLDNIEEGAFSTPSLTTNGVNMKALVRKLLDTLFLRIKDPDVSPTVCRMKTDLIVRESCAAVGHN